MIKWLVMSVIVMFAFDWIRKTMDRGAQKTLASAQKKKARVDAPPPPIAPSVSPAETLGVSTTASWDEIQSAYRKRAAEYHPDKVATSAKEIQDLAQTRLKAINEAYSALSKQHGR